VRLDGPGKKFTCAVWKEKQDAKSGHKKQDYNGRNRAGQGQDRIILH
jgi:hypothetical protein